MRSSEDSVHVAERRKRDGNLIYLNAHVCLHALACTYLNGSADEAEARSLYSLAILGVSILKECNRYECKDDKTGNLQQMGDGRRTT